MGIQGSFSKLNRWPTKGEIVWHGIDLPKTGDLYRVRRVIKKTDSIVLDPCKRDYETIVPPTPCEIGRDWCRPAKQSDLVPNVEVTGAARLYRAASG